MRKCKNRAPLTHFPSPSELRSTPTSWLSHALSWRWALVAYLPLLLLARLVVARQLAALPAPPAAPSKLPVAQALTLALGVALLSVLAWSHPLRWVASGLGLGLVAWAVLALLPAAVRSLRHGQGSAIAAFGVLGALFFGAASVVPLLAHDRLGYSAGELGALLTAGGLAWALVGLYAARHPASEAGLVRRGRVGALALGLGLVGMAAGMSALAPLPFGVGWALMGTGMGLCFLNLMNAAFTADETTALDPAAAATAVVLVESLSVAVTGTLAPSILVAWPDAAVGLLLVLAALCLPLLWLTRRSAY